MRGCSAPKNSSLRLRPGEFRPLEVRAGSAGFQLHGQFGSSRPLFTVFRASVADFGCRQIAGPQWVPGYQKTSLSDANLAIYSPLPAISIHSIDYIDPKKMF
jgi:hypothetical protein